MRLTLLIGALVATATAATIQDSSYCRAYPDTKSWPSAQKWRSLDSQVSGRLESVIPPGAVCYNTFEGKKTYDAAACADFSAGYFLQVTHLENPVSIYYDSWTNRTCLPTDDPNGSCTRGTYPEYVIKAKTVKDVQAGVNFARDNNVRLIIKNTGHDFMGKSIGAGSLSIWTHNFKDIEIIKKYKDPSTTYTGSAVRLGAGWEGAEIYTELAKVGKVIVAGECATVGFSGGYIQGGGHGPLSSIHGMAADSVLQFTIVLADGKLVTADAKNNKDLFWALRGGGGSSWGVVMSVTVKTYDSPSMTGAVIKFDFTQMSADTAWAGIDAFHSFTPGFVDEGIYGYYELSAASLLIKPLLAPGKSIEEFEKILAPLLARFDALGVVYTSTVTTYSNFLDGYQGLFDGEGAGVNMLTSSRIFLRKHVENNNSEITKAMRLSAENGYFIIGHVVSPGQNGGVSKDTSVNPIWKDALLLPLYNYLYDGTETVARKQEVIDDTASIYDVAYKKASPGSGTYLNEANVYEENWAHDFYGASYPRLLSIKKKVDPSGVFYAKTAVGSEYWKEVDGRLCRA